MHVILARAFIRFLFSGASTETCLSVNLRKNNCLGPRPGRFGVFAGGVFAWAFPLAWVFLQFPIGNRTYRRDESVYLFLGFTINHPVHTIRVCKYFGSVPISERSKTWHSAGVHLSLASATIDISRCWREALRDLPRSLFAPAEQYVYRESDVIPSCTPAECYVRTT